MGAIISCLLHKDDIKVNKIMSILMTGKLYSSTLHSTEKEYWIWSEGTLVGCLFLSYQICMEAYYVPGTVLSTL